MKETDFLKFIAIALIFNSHCDKFYPYPVFATGGAIGNSIFFSLWSFGLYLSEQKQPREFGQWIYRRISRLYPAIWCVVIFLIFPLDLITLKAEFGSLEKYLTFLLAPPFWFLKAILFYLILVFIFISRPSSKNLLVATFLVTILYFIFYFRFLNLNKFSIESLPFKYIFYFLIVIYGIFLGRMNTKIKFSGFRDLFFFIFFVSVMYIHKYFIYKGFVYAYYLQFIQQILLFFIVFFLFKISRSPFVKNTIMDNRIFNILIPFVSNITLEIYIVHFSFRNHLVNLNFGFPFNVIIFLTLTLILSVLINRICKRSLDYLNNLKLVSLN